MGGFLRSVGPFFGAACVTIVLAVLATLAANHAAALYLVRNPSWLISDEQRIVMATRRARAALVPADMAEEWFGLESAADAETMWDEFFAAPAEFESYTHFRPSPSDGRFHKQSPHGFRPVRDQGPWPPVASNYNVFFFGGSTAWHPGPYWSSTASQLQRLLDAPDRPVRVYNFGRSSYQSTQSRILLEQLLRDGARPDLVVFLDGLNDFCFRDGRPSTWDFLARQYDGLVAQHVARLRGEGIETRWRNLREFVETMPLAMFVNAAWRRATFEGVPQYGAAPRVEERSPPVAELETVVRRYDANARMVAAIGGAFGFESMFVWQPIPTFRYDNTRHVFRPDRLGCHVGSKFGYPVAEAALRGPDGPSGFVWAADIQLDARENLYVDAFHYTAPMAGRIAAFVAAALAERGLPGPRHAGR